MVNAGTILKLVLLVGGGYLIYRAVEGFGLKGGFAAPARIGGAIGETGTAIAEGFEFIPKFLRTLPGLFTSAFTTGIGTAPGCFSRPAFQSCPAGTTETTDALGFGVCCPAGTTTIIPPAPIPIPAPTGTCGGRTCPPDWYCSIETIPPGIQVQQCKPRYSAFAPIYNPPEMLETSAAPDDRIGGRIEPAGAAEIAYLAAQAEAGTPVYTPGNFREGYRIPEASSFIAFTPERIRGAELREAQERAGYRAIY